MSNLTWLIGKTLRNTFRSKKSWIVYIGLPLVGVLISSLLYGRGKHIAARHCKCGRGERGYPGHRRIRQRAEVR